MDSIQIEIEDSRIRWDTLHFAFVTLWSGKESNLQTLEWLATAEIPPNSVLYWVDNSDGSMTARLHAAWDQRLRCRFRKLVWIDGGDRYRAAPEEHYIASGRHLHVMRLYNRVFPRVFEEMVVTLEDDMVPPLDGLSMLWRLLSVTERAGMVAGVYRNRANPADICAARDKQQWRDAPLFDDLPAEPFEVGMSGGGFALLPNCALQQALPLRCALFRKIALLGWDGMFGRDLAALGYRLVAHPGVRCAHLCDEALAYEATLAVDGDGKHLPE